MSDQITTAFVQQYGRNVQLLVQQKGSRLRGAVMVDSAVRGKRAFYDQIGATTAQLRLNRHGDSPLINTPHARRVLDIAPYEWGDLIDDPDKIRTLIDPTSAYAQNAAHALGRAMDDVIIAAFFATSLTGETGSGSESFTSGQQVAVDFGGANSGLTVEKLREARRILMANEVDPSEPWHIAVNAKNLDYLLGTTEVTSADFNTVRTLVGGTIDTFLGFKFIHSERLLTDANAYRRIPVWSKSGMQLGIGTDMKTRIQERADKRFSTYVFAEMDLGATRMELQKVVEIKSDETT